MPSAVDITGQRYGRLVAVKDVGVRNGHRAWLFKCDCGNETVATSNLVRRGCTQSCGCLRQEYLFLGLRATKVPGKRPVVRQITYDIPENLHPNPLVNEVKRRMMQYRWERVEFEARQIERGNWKERKGVPFLPRDDHGRPIIPLDLRGVMMDRAAERRAQVEDTPASWNTGSSLADRVRVLTLEEWARL